MATVFHMQNSFTRGQLDRRLHARVDLPFYNLGARTIENMLVQSQGSVRRRFGTVFKDDISNRISTPSSFEEIKAVDFTFDKDNSYQIIIAPDSAASKFLIYQQGVFITELTGLPWTPLQIKGIRTTQTRVSNEDQTEEALLIVQEDVQPRILKRTGVSTFQLDTFVFKNQPTFDFKQNYDAITFAITVDGDPGPGKTLTAAIPGGNPFSFSAEYVGGIFIANQGTARITAVTPPNIATIDIIDKFDPIVSLKGTEVLLAEPAFADGDKGWPRSATFFQSRLVFGGSKKLPNSIGLSAINDYRNFDLTQTDADDAIFDLLSADDAGFIEYVKQFKSLIAFTKKGNFVSKAFNQDVVTPSSFYMLEEGLEGVSEVEPVKLDNQIFFVEDGGKIVRNYFYDASASSYQTADVSILSQSLVSDPVDSGAIRFPDIDDGIYLMLINRDGTLAMYQSVINEKVSAWTLCDTAAQTEGKFRRVISDGRDAYFIVERVVNNITKFYLEQADFDTYTDASVVKQPVAQKITGLEYLEGVTVSLIDLDNSGRVVLESKTVSSGEVDLSPQEGNPDNVEVGINYTPRLIPMPVNINTQQGDTLYLKNRIRRIVVDYFESIGIEVNGQIIPHLNLDTLILDTPPPPESNFFEIASVTGWNPREEILITQTVPQPMTILAIGYEVEF